jgi:hypothetical protein
MRRMAIATTMIMALGMVTSGSWASASPIRVHAKTKAPAKVKARSTWSYEVAGSCESDAFAPHHAFSDVLNDGTGDLGTYKGAKKLTMTWTAGKSAGHIFKGTWSKTTGAYTGMETFNGQSVSATLLPASASGCTLAKGTPGMKTKPASTTIPLGSAETDNAIVSGTSGITPTGTVTFYVCPGNTNPCTAGNTANGGASLGSVALSGSAGVATATSPSFTPQTTGIFCFVGLYSGDANYLSASDGSTTNECFTATGGQDLTTTPSSTSLFAGNSVHDLATVTGDGGVTPTGTVTFYVCGPGPSATAFTACTDANDISLGTVSVTASPANANVALASSVNYTPLHTGTYCFLGVYSGDNHYVASTDGSTTDECFTVTQSTSL